jgi:hypothetical protein
MPYESRRLEALLGATFEQLEYRHFVAIEGDRNSIESDDLDWKIRYDEGKDATFELAKDVAALANASGGLLILGVAQDKATSAVSKVVGHPATDRVEREIHQAIAARVFPMPRYQVRRILDPNGDGTIGLIAIGVIRSPYSPHAVLSEQRPEYAYPRRTGNKIQWLTEPEIATAYRRRYNESASRDLRLQEVESDLVNAFYESGSREPLLAISLTPEVPGNFRIDQDSLDAFRASIGGFMPIGVNNQLAFEHVTVGSGRLQATDSLSSPQLHLDLHSDGSGSWGVVPWVHAFPSRTAADDETGFAQIHYIVTQVLNALLTLARHSTERAGTAGTALLRVSLWASVYDHPDLQIHALGAPGGPIPYRFATLRLGHFRHGSRFEEDGIRAARSATSDSVVVLDSITRTGIPLTQTAAFAISALLQTFGIVDVPQIRLDGTVRSWAFYSGEHWWLDWCEANGIPAVRSGT